MLPPHDPAGTSREAPGELTLERVHDRLQIVTRADEWVLLDDELITELTGHPGPDYRGVISVGTSGHGLDTPAYRYVEPGERPGTQLYRRFA